MARKRLIAIAALVTALAGAFLLAVMFPGMIPDFSSVQDVAERLRQSGWIGPFLVVGSMAAAIIASPLPSAPIALAAGAVYGHAFGTLYVVVGATVGALGAFAIARVFGRDLLRHWFGDRVDMGLLGSQNGLMATVFVFRLLPFISFDIVSYAAGLTALTPLRFLVATVAGVGPVSFALTHFGGEIASGEDDRILIAVLALGLLTGVPFLAGYLRRRRSNAGGRNTEGTTRQR